MHEESRGCQSSVDGNDPCAWRYPNLSPFIITHHPLHTHCHLISIKDHCIASVRHPYSRDWSFIKGISSISSTHPFSILDGALLCAELTNCRNDFLGTQVGYLVVEFPQILLSPSGFIVPHCRGIYLGHRRRTHQEQSGFKKAGIIIGGISIAVSTIEVLRDIITIFTGEDKLVEVARKWGQWRMGWSLAGLGSYISSVVFYFIGVAGWEWGDAKLGMVFVAMGLGVVGFVSTWDGVVSSKKTKDEVEEFDL